MVRRDLQEQAAERKCTLAKRSYSTPSVPIDSSNRHKRPLLSTEGRLVSTDLLWFKWTKNRLIAQVTRKPDGSIEGADFSEFIGEANHDCSAAEPIYAERYIGLTRNCAHNGTLLTE